jgi:hypothetical protein
MCAKANVIEKNPRAEALSRLVAAERYLFGSKAFKNR